MYAMLVPHDQPSGELCILPTTASHRGAVSGFEQDLTYPHQLSARYLAEICDAGGCQGCRSIDEVPFSNVICLLLYVHLTALEV